MTGQAASPPARRVVYVIGNLDVGGAERHLSHVAVGLRARGMGVTICVLSRPGALATALKNHGVQVVPPPFVDHLSKWPSLLRHLVLLPLAAASIFWVLWRTRPDIVHFFLPAAYLIGGLVSLVAPARIRVMSRRSLNLYQRRHPIATQIEQWLHRRMNAVLGNSSAVVAELRDEGVALERLGIIYNGVEVAPPRPANYRKRMRRRLRVGEDTLVMAIVANLISYKGHADLIDALAGIAAHLPEDWQLLVIGEDRGIGNSLRCLARQCGIANNVRWLGHCSDARSILPAADIGILCSHQEGFSNAILEGMAEGLPMVVTDVGGNTEAVIDGETGIVVPVRSPTALGKAILRLAHNADERTRMGGAGRRRVENEFRLDVCVSRYRALYEGLITSCPELVTELIRTVELSKES